jgi:hypothetical protein
MDKGNDYPHPNPHFPPPPRPMPKLGFPGVLLAAGGTALSLLALALSLRHEWTPGTMVSLPLFVTGFAATPLLLNERIKARKWRNGRILPARIVQAPRTHGPSKLWLPLMFIPIIGHLIGLIADLAVRRASEAKIAYCMDGTIYEFSWEPGKDYRKVKQLTDIWILVENQRRVYFIERRAPKRYWYQPVPRDAVEYLDPVIPEEAQQQARAHRQALLEADLREAAKANSRAVRRSV